MCDTDNMLAAVRQRLNSKHGEWPRISRATEVPYSTLAKIAQGVVVNPRIGTVQALYNHLCQTTKAA